ncbi:hypothetical protein P154DRAFT_573407 [Amniculicola lignicola CBS 123094]|uniref:Uncharacterized protein n=1 Tax=Amniculicola lignicola CBS 123094 TaxID=1392246 RepID=A0A6A5WN89_9PLEO|nr:hypothetical protein P154DRAFT_573407 [Amniculicola lignicola CBS 123094]
MDLVESSIDDDVYTGIWINRSLGNVYGATLTLDQRSGAFLIAFLALYVGTTSRYFWKLLRYLIYHSLSSPLGADGIYHQRQAILRNTELAHDAALELLSVAFAWRRKSNGNWKRTMPIALLAAIVSALFIVAGIFSSRVTDTVNEVLLKGKLCGNMTGQEAGGNQSYFGIYAPNVTTYRTKRATEYLTYALRCYGHAKTLRSDKCQTFAVSSLPYTKDASARCPFNQGSCVFETDNIALDTGYLDSYKHFGVNNGPRVSVRLRRQCAPIVQKNNRLRNALQNPFLNYVQNNRSTQEGAPLSISQRRPKDRNSSWSWDTADYQLLTANFSPASGCNLDSCRNSGLYRNDSLVSVIHLGSTDIINVYKTEDPWFNASTPVAVPWDSQMELGFKEYYVASEPARVLGCATQISYCDPELPKTIGCREAFVDEAAEKGSKELWPDPQARAKVRGLQYALSSFRTFAPGDYYSSKSIPSLLTRFSMTSDGLQPVAIPKDRWKEEVEYIFQTNLAAMQSRMVEHARAEFNVLHESSGKTLECYRMCYSQRIKSSRFYSFKILGLSVIIFAGGFIMLLGAWVEDILSKISSSKRKLSYGNLEWSATSTLQLQRLAHEALGLGTWSHGTGDVPVTEKDETLGLLDTSNPKHPRFVRPGTGKEISMAQFDLYGSERTFTSTTGEGNAQKDLVKFDKGPHTGAFS